jgi:hypothetical protein
VQIGLSELENCCAWHPAHGKWPEAPGRLGTGAFDSRRWHKRHGNREWFRLLCMNRE